jgi:hypothetical protein
MLGIMVLGMAILVHLIFSTSKADLRRVVQQARDVSRTQLYVSKSVALGLMGGFYSRNYIFLSRICDTAQPISRLPQTLRDDFASEEKRLRMPSQRSSIRCRLGGQTQIYSALQ